MSAKYVSDRLLQSNRSIKSAPGLQEDTSSSDNAAQAPHDDLGRIIDRENRLIRNSAEARDIEEVSRRRVEVAEKLDSLLNHFEHQQKSIEEEMAFFHHLQAELNKQANEVVAENLGEIRRLVKTVDLEIMQREQKSGLGEADVENAITPSVGLAQLPFRELTRIGLSLTWPLVVGLLLAAGIVGLFMLILFKV